MTKLSRVIVKYAYLAGDLLGAAYQDARGHVPVGDAAGDLPRLARETGPYLLSRALPLETAGPGDYLHVPGMSLDLIDRSAGSHSWTAAVLTSSQDAGSIAPGGILLLLIGPVENCREWIAAPDAPRMPSPATPQAMEQVIRALAADGGYGDPQGPLPALAQALAEPSWPAREHEVLARVLIREPARPPYGTIVVATPLWARETRP